jgi:DNA-binding transcriptional ArsR family regulator
MDDAEQMETDVASDAAADSASGNAAAPASNGTVASVSDGAAVPASGGTAGSASSGVAAAASDEADAFGDDGAYADKASDAPCEMPDEELLYDLADLFKVFADTTRIRILYVLMEREMCVAEIADAVGVSQSAVSHQLRILKQAHLIKFQRAGKQIIYSLSDDHVYTMLSQGMTHICE